MSTKIKHFFEQSWLLMAASVVFGVLLAVTDAAWKPRIEQNVVNRFTALAGGLLTEAERFEPISPSISIDVKGKTVPVEVKRALNAAGQTVGWAFVCEGSGFADKIRLVVATDAAFARMAGFGVLFSNETPGFGDKINITPADGGFYQPQFIGAPITTLTLTKTGDPTAIDDQIVAISGATVTSQAVVDIFNAYINNVKIALKEKQLIP